MTRSVLYAEMAVTDATVPLVLTMGIEDVVCSQQAHFVVHESTSTEDALSILEREQVSVIVLGQRLKPAGVRAILNTIVRCKNNPLAIVAGIGVEPEFLQEFVDSGVVFYISRGCLTSGQLHTIVAAAIRRCARSDTKGDSVFLASESCSERKVEYGIRLLNQSEAASVGGLLVEAVLNVIRADSARCLLYDAEKDTLSSLGTREETTESAASGIVAFAARTGSFIELACIGADSRYDAEADNPEGAPDDRLVVAPVVDLRGAPIAVLVATRSMEKPVFSSHDIAGIHCLSEYASLSLNLILTGKRLERLLLEQKQAPDVFLREALDYHTGVHDVEGNLVQTSPAWLTRSHWLTIALFAASLMFLVVARVKGSAEGLAVIRARSKITLTAPTDSLVRSVELGAGVGMKRGALLVRFQDLHGINRHDDVHDELRAPGDGIVGDVFVRPGQQVSAGDPVATVIDPDAGYELVIAFPGQYAPQIQHGMLGSFSVDGYPDSHQLVDLDDVGSEILGAREVARYAELADRVTVIGPVVVVRCHLKSTRFSAGSRAYIYRDGMTAHAEVVLHSEPMVFNLLPGLKELIGILR